MANSNFKNIKKKKNTEKGNIYITFILLIFVLVWAFHWYQERKFPTLMAYGIKDWKTICEDESRVYRLRSQNLLSGTRRLTFQKKSFTSRNLQFLDKEGKIRYFTNDFDHRSLDQDAVWRFKHSKNKFLLATYFQTSVLKNEKDQNKILRKILDFVFSADFEKFKHKNPDKVLKGDEKIFEITKNLDKITVVLENMEILQLPCKIY